MLAVLFALASIGCGIYGALEKNLMFLLAAAVFLGLGVYFVIYYRSTGITYTGLHLPQRKNPQNLPLRGHRGPAGGRVQGKRLSGAVPGGR